MRNLRYHVATSLDGFIAAADGSFDSFMVQHGGALAQGPHVDDFLASFAGYSAVLMGRKTYDVGLREGKTNPYPTLQSLVFSRSMEKSPDPAVELVAGNAVERVRRLKEEDGGDVWLCGGGDLAGQLLAAGLVDEVVVKLNPFVQGAGITLFSGVVEPTDLELTATKDYGNGVLLLSYRVVGPQGR